MSKSNCRETISQFLLASNLIDKLNIANQLLNIASVNKLSFISEAMLTSNQSFINELWEYLKPDYIRKRDGIDESRNLLRIHLTSLKLLIILRSSPNIDATHFNAENFQFVFEFLSLCDSKMHADCCIKGLDNMWSIESIRKAKTLMNGQVYMAIMELSGEAYSAEFKTIETQENVINLLAQEFDVNMNNLIFNLSSSQASSEIVKVIHVVSPEYVWVQEFTDDINELTIVLEEHITTNASIACPEHYQTIVKYKKMVFRAQVTSWSEKTAVVFAVDYGWEVEVDRNNVFQSEDHIAEIPPLAKLCKIINVGPPCENLDLQRHAIKFLQTCTRNQQFVGKIVQSNQMYSIINLLKESRNSSLVCDILLLFSQCSFHHKIRELVGSIILLPVIKCLERWYFCIEVQALGFECCRNLLHLVSQNREIFIFNGGLELTFSAYTTHKNDKVLYDHVLHILKICLKDFEFDCSVDNEENIPHDVLANPYLQMTSESTNEFLYSHLNNMHQYYFESYDNVSFINDITTHEELVIFSREIVSHLNSPDGGTVFIGVTCQGLINAIQMNRSRKDEYRTKLDMVFLKMITDYNLMELPEQLFNCSFQKVKNSHNRAMPSDTIMYMIKILIKRSKKLCRLKEGETNVFFKRHNGCVVPIPANELRQHYAHFLSSEQQNPNRQSKDYLDDKPVCEHVANISLPRKPQMLSNYNAFKVPDLFSSEIHRDLSVKNDGDKRSGPPPLLPISELHLNK